MKIKNVLNKQLLWLINDRPQSLIAKQTMLNMIANQVYQTWHNPVLEMTVYEYRIRQ